MGRRCRRRTTVDHDGAEIFGNGVIQVYQPLTQLYSAHLNVQLLKVGKQLSEEQLRQQRQQITDSVKRLTTVCCSPKARSKPRRKT